MRPWLLPITYYYRRLYIYIYYYEESRLPAWLWKYQFSSVTLVRCVRGGTDYRLITYPIWIRLPRDPLTCHTVFFCHLLGIQHSHWATPATVTHDRAACSATKLVSRGPLSLHKAIRPKFTRSDTQSTDDLYHAARRHDPKCSSHCLILFPAAMAVCHTRENKLISISRVWKSYNFRLY